MVSPSVQASLGPVITTAHKGKSCSLPPWLRQMEGLTTLRTRRKPQHFAILGQPA